MSKLDRLKFALFTEWCEDPPAGCVTFYYPAWGNTYRDLLWPVGEIHDHLEIEMSCSEYGDEFEEVCSSPKASANYLNGFSFDTGGAGCGCRLLKGRDIAPAALELYEELKCWSDTEEDFEEDFEEEPEEEPEEVRAVRADPEDHDSVVSLLVLLGELADRNNSSVD